MNNNRRNILFILADDLGWSDLSCYGSKFYETPNLDKLLQKGIGFDEAYASAPICSPTRASILSGKYPARLGLTNFIAGNKANHPSRGRLIDAPYVDHLPLEEISIAKALKKNGYSTWHVGKWHLGEATYYPENHGFDVNIGGCHLGRPSNGYFSPWNIDNLDNGVEGEYLTDHLTDQAIRLIEEQDSDSPFFLNMSYYSVHTPIEAKREHIEKFEEKARRLGLDRIDPFEIGKPYPTERKMNQRIVRRKIQSDPIYAAMLYSLDENIGRLLEAIQKVGKERETIVVFTSDNGGLSSAEGSPTCNYPLHEGKGWMAEGGIRVPLIFHIPEISGDMKICHQPVNSTDFYPTLLDLIGAEPLPEQHLDGVSLKGILEGEAEKLEREALFWHYPHYGNNGGTPGSIIRWKNYKLIEYFQDGQFELYDLKQDIGESNNILSEYPDVFQIMYKKLCDWRLSIGARYPTINGQRKITLKEGVG